MSLYNIFFLRIYIFNYYFLKYDILIQVLCIASNPNNNGNL